MWLNDADVLRGLSDVVGTTVKTAAAADNDDDASQFDVTAPRHPKRLLLISMGQRSTTKLVLLSSPRKLYILYLPKMC